MPVAGLGLSNLRCPRLHAPALALLLLVAGLAGCGSMLGRGDDPCALPAPGTVLRKAGLKTVFGAPEIGSGYTRKALASGRRELVVAAHPLAAQAGCRMLQGGGSAVDAAVAVQMVLNLVEPQSSGLGGGGFMLHYRAADGLLSAFDGRETAPAASTPDDLRWIGRDDRRAPQPNARASGRAIGTPGLLHMLDAAHRHAGRMPWPQLFEPALRLAEQGFPISPRLADSIAAAVPALERDARARALFLDADGRALRAGSLLRNPALAVTFRQLAEQGAAAFYRGPIAEDIVQTITGPRHGVTPGRTTLADLAGYRSRKREAICTAYRAYIVCGMPPPSSGGLAVAQALGILQHVDLHALGPTQVDADGGRPSVLAVHLVSEAQRLAYADRDRYVADADFVPLPGGSVATLLDPAYLQQRAGTIRLARSMGVAAAGEFGAPMPGVGVAPAEQGTTQVSIVDRDGDVVVLTSTIESAFGSYHMTAGGFLLNNQLTDFSREPTDSADRAVANRLQGGKRPRSSMAPTLVFARRADGTRGDFVMATGSPGGAAIIQYVIKTLVGVLDWGLDAQQASALIDFGAVNGPRTFVGGEHPAVDLSDGGRNDGLYRGLQALGHEVDLSAQGSGIATIVRRASAAGQAVYDGGADPRREGVAIGPLARFR